MDLQAAPSSAAQSSNSSRNPRIPSPGRSLEILDCAGQSMAPNDLSAVGLECLLSAGGDPLRTPPPDAMHICRTANLPNRKGRGIAPTALASSVDAEKLRLRR